MEQDRIVNDRPNYSHRQLWQMFGASRRMFAFSIFAGLISGACNAWLLVFINRAMAAGQTGSVSLAPTFFGVCFLVLASGAFSLTMLSRMAQANLCNLRLWLTRRILAAPFQHMQSCGPHRLMAALTDDVGSVVNAQEALPMLFIGASTLLASLTYLGFLAPSLLLLVLGFLVVGVISFLLPQNAAAHWMRLARDADNILFRHFRAVIEGAKELKMDARVRHALVNEELSDTLKLVERRRNKAWLIYVLTDRWGQSLYFLLIGVILFWPPFTDKIPRETLTGFTLVILFLSGPISAILHAVPIIGIGAVALRNLEALGLSLPAEPEIGATTGAPVQLRPQPILELSRVSHRYHGESEESGQQLGPLTLRVIPGELVFVTGGNGSGKTTLALIILGLFPPATGEVRLDGQLITNENRDAYRQNFSAVFADSFIFDSLLGYSTNDLEPRAQELLMLLQLKHKLRIENGRFSTIDLSRGQRKRLALLAAYLADRPFYLFDECAAEQDPVFRDTFYHEMLPTLKARGKTVIVITHDDRYFHLCDRLLRLTFGKMEEVDSRSAAQERRPARK